MAPTDEDDMSGDALGGAAVGILESYRDDPRGHLIGRRYLPSRSETREVVQLLLQLFFPGYFGRQDLTETDIDAHVKELLGDIRTMLRRQIEKALCYAAEIDGTLAVGDCGPHADRVTDLFLTRLPSLRRLLLDDVQAAFDGDPAATNLDEVILAYPGLLAVTVYRVAHELHEMGIPLLPRIMTEWAHSVTGCDLHPGAVIGPRFFIDHATGVVVGETSLIGTDVKLYQGVTLGAISHPKDERGRVIRNMKRHPTAENGVTVYANATVLGGDTVLGAGSVVGGGVFLTKSVPAGSRIAMKPPELTVKAPKESGQT
ncbi:serine acetyltransferase [soil metagenome]